MIMTVNKLDTISPDVVEAVREGLVGALPGQMGRPH